MKEVMTFEFIFHGHRSVISLKKKKKEDVILDMNRMEYMPIWLVEYGQQPAPSDAAPMMEWSASLYYRQSISSMWVGLRTLIRVNEQPSKIAYIWRHNMFPWLGEKTTIYKPPTLTLLSWKSIRVALYIKPRVCRYMT